MEAKGKYIVILLYQYSVVVKGIERRLKDAGYLVDVVEDFNQIPNMTFMTDVFLLYLPTDIMDHEDMLGSFTKVCASLNEKQSKVITIGETQYQRELKAKVPALNAYMWLNRPVEMDVLIPAIEKVNAEGNISSEKKRILIVDDDPSYAGMVREWIKEEYQTDIVTAGMQAIKFLLKHKVDIILLDYEMPIVDGPQVLQMLRQEEATANIPVIFLTGIGTKEAVSRVMSLKPDGYVLKSTTRDNLLKFLHEKL